MRGIQEGQAPGRPSAAANGRDAAGHADADQGRGEPDRAGIVTWSSYAACDYRVRDQTVCVRAFEQIVSGCHGAHDLAVGAHAAGLRLDGDKTRGVGARVDTQRHAVTLAASHETDS